MKQFDLFVVCLSSLNEIRCIKWAHVIATDVTVPRGLLAYTVKAHTSLAHLHRA